MAVREELQLVKGKINSIDEELKQKKEKMLEYEKCRKEIKELKTKKHMLIDRLEILKEIGAEEEPKIRFSAPSNSFVTTEGLSVHGKTEAAEKLGKTVLDFFESLYKNHKEVFLDDYISTMDITRITEHGNCSLSISWKNLENATKIDGFKMTLLSSAKKDFSDSSKSEFIFEDHSKQYHFISGLPADLNYRVAIQAFKKGECHCKDTLYTRKIYMNSWSY